MPQPERETTGSPFGRLLQWLDSDPDQAEERYKEIRQKLIRYFLQYNQSPAADQADETIERVAKIINDPDKVAGYQKPEALFLAVAKNVRLEGYREQRKCEPIEEVNLSHLGQSSEVSQDDSSHEVWEQDDYCDCLQECRQKMPAKDWNLTINYYAGGDDEGEGKRNRQELARRLKITTTALSSRVLRLRRKLELCIKNCVAARRAE